MLSALKTSGKSISPHWRIYVLHRILPESPISVLNPNGICLSVLIPRQNKYPQPETEYHVPLLEDDPGYQILEISNVNTEFGLRFKKYYESGDYAFFAASLNENQPSYSAASGSGNDKIELEKKYPPHQLLGVGGNMIFSNTIG
jgi:hypothetical protein